MRRPSGVKEMPRRTTDSVGKRVMSAPSSQMCPSVTGAAPMIAASVVDFPAPFGPNRASTSPGRASNETSWTARIGP